MLMGDLQRDSRAALAQNWKIKSYYSATGAAALDRSKPAPGHEVPVGSRNRTAHSRRVAKAIPPLRVERYHDDRAATSTKPVVMAIAIFSSGPVRMLFLFAHIKRTHRAVPDRDLNFRKRSS